MSTGPARCCSPTRIHCSGRPTALSATVVRNNFLAQRDQLGDALAPDASNTPRSRSIRCSTDCLQSTDYNQFAGASLSRRPIIGDWPDLDCGSILKTTCCGPNATL